MTIITTVYKKTLNYIGHKVVSSSGGLGLGKGACAKGSACLRGLNLWKGSNTLGNFKTGRTKLLH